MAGPIVILQIAPFFWKAYKKRKGKKSKSVEKEVSEIAVN